MRLSVTQPRVFHGGFLCVPGCRALAFRSSRDSTSVVLVTWGGSEGRGGEGVEQIHFPLGGISGQRQETTDWG